MAGRESRWQAWRSLREWVVDRQRVLAAERELAVPAVAGTGRVAGSCGVCGSARGFDAPGNLREGLACAGCGCNARQRAAAMVLIEALAGRPEASVYLTEQASRLFVALRRRWPGLEGSEFGLSLAQRARLSAWLWRRGVPTWIRQRDVTALTIRDDALDGILSLDVLEHVPDADAALREFARVAHSGGLLALTVPFYEDAAHSEQVARLCADGRLEHRGGAEYHGDPVRGGVPCFHHFGWDLLDRLREAGFANVCAMRVTDPARGLPGGQWVIRAVR